MAPGYPNQEPGWSNQEATYPSNTGTKSLASSTNHLQNKVSGLLWSGNFESSPQTKSTVALEQVLLLPPYWGVNSQFCPLLSVAPHLTRRSDLRPRKLLGPAILQMWPQPAGLPMCRTSQWPNLTWELGIQFCLFHSPNCSLINLGACSAAPDLQQWR